MKRVSLIALTAALALALASGAAFAQANALISVGVESHSGDEPHVYFYGEVGLTPNLVGSFEFANNHPLVIGLWRGIGQGLYGEVALASGGASQATVEVGVWRDLPLSANVAVLGWIGVQTQLGGGQGVWASGGADLEVALTQSISLFAGVETTLLKDPSTTATWVGLGLYF